MLGLSDLELSTLRKIESFVTEGHAWDAEFADLDAIKLLPANARPAYEPTQPRPEVFMDCMLHQLVIDECGNDPGVIPALNRLCNRGLLWRIEVPVVPALGPLPPCFATPNGRH